MKTLIITNEEMNDIMKLVKSLEESEANEANEKYEEKQFKLKQEKKTTDFSVCY